MIYEKNMDAHVIFSDETGFPETGIEEDKKGRNLEIVTKKKGKAIHKDQGESRMWG